MVIAVIRIRLRLPSRTLKEKRAIVKSTVERLRTRFNVAASEISHQEDWQRGVIAAVTVSPDRAHAEQVLEAVERHAALFLGPILTDATVEWLA